MIAYFDTSSIIPLIIEEPSSESCARLWDESTRVVSARLAYAEARAALAHARRVGRLTPAQLSAATAELDRTISEIDHVEVSESIVRAAGDFAEVHALRGYDAVHLAAARSIADDDVVLVTGDASLAAAGTQLGLAVSRTT